MAISKFLGVTVADARSIGGVSNSTVRDLFAGDSSLLAYYRFDGDLLKDMSGNGLTLSNGNSVSQGASGKFGKCADFGSTQLHNKTLSTTGLTGLTGDLSVAFWMKLNAEVNGAGYVYTIFDAAVNGYKGVSLKYSYNSGNRQVYLTAGGSNINVSSYSIGTAAWVHFVVTRGTNTVYKYRNGSREDGSLGTTQGSSNAAATNFVIGNIAAANAGTAGLFDEVLVFNKALSQDEINSIYNLTATTKIGKITGVAI